MSQEKFYIQDISTEDLKYDLGILIQSAARRSSSRSFSSELLKSANAYLALAPFLYYACLIIHELKKRNELRDQEQMRQIQEDFYASGKFHESDAQAFKRDHAKLDTQFYNDFLIWLNEENILIAKGNKLNLDLAKQVLNKTGTEEILKSHKREPETYPFRGILKKGKLAQVKINPISKNSHEAKPSKNHEKCERYLNRVSKKIRGKSIKFIINRLYESPENIVSQILLNLIEHDDRFKSIKEKINKRLDKFSAYIVRKIDEYDRDLEKAIKAEKQNNPINQFEVDLLQAKKRGIESIIEKFKGQNKTIKDKMTHIKEGLKELEDIHEVLFAKRANSFFDAISGRSKWNEVHSSDSEYFSGVESFSDSEDKANSGINPLRTNILNYLNHRPKSVFDYFRPASKGEKLYEKIHEVAEKKLGIGKF